MKFAVCLFDFAGPSNIEIRERIDIHEQSISLEIFRTIGAWIGVRCVGSDAHPINPTGSLEVWHLVHDENLHENWWFLARKVNGKLVSELYRSIGNFTVEWSNGEYFNLQLECSALEEGTAEKILKDFKDTLVELIRSDDNPLKIKHQNYRSHNSAEFEQLLHDYTRSLRQIIERPKRRISLETLFVRADRVKGSGFDAVRLLRGRTRNIVVSNRYREDIDLSENRFVLFCAYKIIELLAALRFAYETSFRDGSDIQKCESLIRECISDLELRGTTISSQCFSKIVFQNNPWYAKNINCYKRLVEINKSKLDAFRCKSAISNIRIEHLSAIYEKWCLLRIIFILYKNYRFVPEEGWINKVTSCVRQSLNNIAVTFKHQDSGQKIRLTYQCEFQFQEGGTVRPDYVLESLGDDGTISSSCKLVLDAKLRTFIGNNGSNRLLTNLRDDKNYGQGGKNMVFILHPCKGVRNEYGLRDKSYSGWISALPDTDGLKLVILEWLQYLELQERIAGLRVCYQCGHAGTFLTESLGDPGNFTCVSCGAERIVTRCFSCHYSPIIKNGNENYFKYVKNSPRNVICPSCGNFFKPYGGAFHD